MKNFSPLSEASPPRWSLVPIGWLNDASLPEAALAYARAGLPVFPLKPRSKIPMVPRGVYAATCDLDRVQHWWQATPRANIGMPTGQPSGCWVLDVDPRHQGLESLARLHANPWHLPADVPLYDTRAQLTGGGGVHFCYRLRADLDVQFTNTTSFAGYAGLDLRVGGGYIVVAPSQHQNGDYYRWHNDLALLPFPRLLVEAWRIHRQRELAQPAPFSSRAPRSPSSWWREREADPEYWLTCALNYGQYGSRHRYALFLAYKLLDDVGLPPEEAEPYLVEYAQQVPQDGLEVPPEERWGIEEALDCLMYVARKRCKGMGE